MEKKARKCPYCGRTARWEGNPFRPFCSERCKEADLGRWASEQYKVPAEPPEGREPEEEAEEQDDKRGNRSWN